jgi:hypothetical protein
MRALRSVLRASGDSPTPHTLRMIVLAVAVQIARVVSHPIEDLIDTTFLLENLTLSNAEQRRQG